MLKLYHDYLGFNLLPEKRNLAHLVHFACDNLEIVDDAIYEIIIKNKGRSLLKEILLPKNRKSHSGSLPWTHYSQWWTSRF